MVNSPLPPLTPRQWAKVQRALMKEINRNENHLRGNALSYEPWWVTKLKKEATDLRRIRRIIQEWRKQNA